VTIRTRVSLWYAGLLTASLILLAGVLYFELVIERAARERAGIPHDTVEEEIAEAVIFYGAPAAVLLLAGGWRLMGRALRPLDELTRAVERIHLNTLDERLPRSGQGDELDRLAEVFNGTMGRLEASFAQIRDFTLNASHELKTPLAVLHVELETLMNAPDTSAAQREALASHLDEIQRLSRIVEGLTLLARADAGRLPMHREELSLDELVRDCCADAQILAQARGVTFELDACEEARVRGDRHRLRQLLLNLADNAVKYADAGGRAGMSLRREPDHARICLTNSGPGIPPSQLPKVFDRFYRGENVLADEVEGCGLGLSIARSIVQAHDGDIAVDSTPGERTTVTVRLPAC